MKYLTLDCLFAAGCIAAFTGLWMAWPPAALVVGGVGAVLAAWRMHR